MKDKIVFFFSFFQFYSIKLRESIKTTVSGNFSCPYFNVTLIQGKECITCEFMNPYSHNRQQYFRNIPW